MSLNVALPSVSVCLCLCVCVCACVYAPPYLWLVHLGLATGPLCVPDARQASTFLFGICLMHAKPQPSFLVSA